jgi:hypothetical protein
VSRIGVALACTSSSRRMFRVIEVQTVGDGKQSGDTTERR